MKTSIIILFCFVSLNISSQDYFVKKISFDEGSNTGRRIFFHQDRLFMLAGHFCEGLECGSIAELSFDGDTIWRTRMPDIDIARSTVTIYGDTITATGNNAMTLSQFRMGHFNLEGIKLGETIAVEHPVEKFNSMFQLNTIRFQNKTLVTGRGIQNDTMQGLIYVMNDQNSLDTLIRLEPQDRRSVIWDVEINSQGELLTFHDIEEDAFGIWYKKINKFDKEFNLIWTYKSEVSNDWDSGSIGTVLEDGRVLLITYSLSGQSSNRSIRAINQDKTIDWQYNPPFNDFDSGYETSYEIKQLPSGDLLGMGRYTDMSLDDPISDAPFLYKMNTEGDIIWKRIFYEIDPQTEKTRRGFVRDAVELDNGDIYGIGEMKYDGINNVFVFKVDEDGCLDAEDCGFKQLITNSKDTYLVYDIHIFPNPTNDILNINFNAVESDLEYVIIDNMGREISNSEKLDRTKSINIRNYNTGIYTIVFFDKGVLAATKRFIKK